MGNKVSRDDIMRQEALKRSVSSSSSPGAQENGGNNSKSANDPGEEGETTSAHELETTMKLRDPHHQVSGGELDSRVTYNVWQARELSIRADSLEAEFEHTDTVESIENTVKLRQQALALTPEGHVDRAERLSEFGVSLRLRFERLGDPADVNKAIEYLAQAVRLTSDDHKYRAGRLSGLGSAYARRFERLGKLEDVEKAIECLTQAVRLTPDDDANKAPWLNNLGNSYQLRFERLGEVADLDKAIECQTHAMLLTPDGRADKPLLLSNLGNSYRFRFERHGDVADIDTAIECQSQSLLLGPDGHASKPSWLSNLGTSYQRRFWRLGKVADIDKAIECESQAVLLTPDGHADKPSLLHNLGSSYNSRFERLSELADVNKAIECQSQAVLLSPDGHALKPNWLSSLGNSYLRRFGHLGEVADVDKAIECQSQAVLLTPDGHAHKPNLLNNLGLSYRNRFERLRAAADVDKAIECHSQALRLSQDNQPQKPMWLTNLGNSYQRRFEHSGEAADIDKAIECHSQAVSLTPDGHPEKPLWLENLGGSYTRRVMGLGQPSDIESARSSYQAAAQHIVGNPSCQIRCARNWAVLSFSLGISPLQAHEKCMELIPQLIWLGTTITQRYELLTTISDFVAFAVAWAISVHDYDHALEWLEQGRSVVWSQILQLRSPFDDLADVDPTLAKSLTSIAAKLENAGTRATETPSANNTISPLEKDAQNHRHLAEEWEKALAKARDIPGFESFMKPRMAKELKRSATDGPIVLINTHRTRSDALIIVPECDDIIHLPLTNLSLDKAAGFRDQLYFLARHRGGGDRALTRAYPDHEDPFRGMLADIWFAIVKPVLDALACTRQVSADELPHVTWCSTGTLAFLPLHAAGLYDGSSPNACDLVISSYTPTLGALLASNNPTGTSDLGVLAVGQQYTPSLPPLHCTVEELTAIKNHAKTIGYHQLDGEMATANAVLDAMAKHSWVHLACHASQNPGNPVQSAFHLHDGSLTLETITKRQFKNKGLAFLSACQTAAGDEKLPDEAVHLAAGMLMAGYPSVIATMWPMCDEDGPEVAERVYAELLKDGKMDRKGAARALHKAVAGLRAKIGEDSFKRWVPFVHIGV